MEIKHRVYNQIFYIVLSGELDEHTSLYVRERLDELLSEKNFKQVVVDLSELSFMDSTGVGVLIGRYKKMKERNIPIYICNPTNQIEKIFKMTGLYDIMPKIS